MLSQSTLLVVQISFTLLITLLLSSIALTGNAPTEQRLWALGNVVSCLGLAIGATETLPLWAHGALSYGLMGVGLSLVLRGLLKFCGSDLSNRTVATIAVFALILPGYFAVIEPNFQARLLITGLFFGTLNLTCAWTLWSRLRDGARKVMWASLLGFFGLGAALIVRALYMVSTWGESVSSANTDLVVSLTLLAIPIAQVSASFGLIVMVAHRYATELNRLSMLDSLTGAFNRSAIERISVRTLNRARQSGRSVSIAMVDADHFKSINDSYGHPAGDQVLIHLVGILSAQLRPGDLVVRYGGEEFMLLLDGLNVAGARGVAERLRRTVESSPVTIGKNSIVNYRISIGISCTDSHGYDLKKLIDKSDGALYQAKHQGRNCVCEG